MEIDRTKYSENSRFERRKSLLVLVLGEYADTALVVADSFLEAISSGYGRILFMEARQKKLFGGRMDDPLALEFDGLRKRAESFGVATDRITLSSRSPYGEVFRTCLDIAEKERNATFCFIQWGLEGEKTNIRKLLQGESLHSVTILELMRELREGEAHEC